MKAEGREPWPSDPILLSGPSPFLEGWGGRWILERTSVVGGSLHPFCLHLNTPSPGALSVSNPKMWPRLSSMSSARPHMSR